MNDNRNISVSTLLSLANTFRMASNTLDSTKRETCLDRDIMRSWNTVVDLINEHTPTQSERLSYYNELGQTPKVK